MARSRIPRRYRYRFKGYSFKLTYKQKDTVERCARLQGITTNRLIKNALRNYLDKYHGMLEEDSWIAENQLSLFGKENVGAQLTIFDEINKKKD